MSLLGVRSVQESNICIVFLKRSVEYVHVKFIYSEKATKFCEIFTLHLSYVVPVKSKVKILQNFVAFSEYMNFTKNTFWKELTFSKVQLFLQAFWKRSRLKVKLKRQTMCNKYSFRQIRFSKDFGPIIYSRLYPKGTTLASAFHTQTTIDSSTSIVRFYFDIN